MELITEAASECNIHTSNIFFIGPLDAPQAKGCRSWQVLLIEGECDWSAATGQDGWDQQRTAVYGMTSGTTGPPKAAMIPHRYIVAQTAELEHQFRARPYQVLSSPTTPPAEESSVDMLHSLHNSSVCLSFMRSRHPWHLFCLCGWVFPPSSSPSGPFWRFCEASTHTPSPIFLFRPRLSPLSVRFRIQIVACFTVFDSSSAPVQRYRKVFRVNCTRFYLLKRWFRSAGVRLKQAGIHFSLGRKRTPPGA